MFEPQLRLHDGFSHTSPELRGLVQEVQSLLRRYRPDVVADGLFGDGTEESVRAFQRACGLFEDGVVGPATWRALLDPTSTLGPDHLATTYPLDHPLLLEELEPAARHGADVEAAALESGLSPSVIVALASRASRIGLALTPRGPAGTTDLVPRLHRVAGRTGTMPPDGEGFARGLLQLDYDRHAFAREGDWREARANLVYGSRIVAEAKRALRRRGVLAGLPLLRAALASTSCGLANVLRALRRGLDVDFYTPRRDFARDVLNRAGFFQAHGWD